MERRTNSPAKLAEEIHGDLDGDILGGIMANHEFIRSRAHKLGQPRDTKIEQPNSEALPGSGVIFEANSTETVNS